MMKVELLGELGNKFGNSYSLDVKTPAEAIRALCANFRTFRSYMENSDKEGVGYQILTQDDNVTLDEIHNPASKTIKIVPVMMGAKGGGLLPVIIGAALIVASFYIPGSIFFIEAALATGIGVGTMATAALAIGASLMLSGVTQMLSPTPQVSSTTGYTNENEEKKPSYFYNGAVNTTSQGHAIPLGYGRLIIGSAVVSAGTDIVDIRG